MRERKSSKRRKKRKRSRAARSHPGTLALSRSPQRLRLRQQLVGPCAVGRGRPRGGGEYAVMRSREHLQRARHLFEQVERGPRRAPASGRGRPARYSAACLRVASLPRNARFVRQSSGLHSRRRQTRYLTTGELLAKAIIVSSGSFASSVPTLRSASARNRTLQTFNEPLACQEELA